MTIETFDFEFSLSLFLSARVFRRFLLVLRSSTLFSIFSSASDITRFSIADFALPSARIPNKIRAVLTMVRQTRDKLCIPVFDFLVSFSCDGDMV